MILYPAIDIRGGRAVRLVQGDFEREMEFDADPLDAARRWEAGGARFLHLIDLDGAREGRPVNLEELIRIASTVRISVQCGGGFRDSVSVAQALREGVDRVVLGTGALTDPDFVGAVADAHPGRVYVSLDVRDGRLAHSGWIERSEAKPAELVAAMAKRGVGGFVYTPVETDGTLEGPGVSGLWPIAEATSETGCELIYSGGVGSLEHLRGLATLGLSSLRGVIVGRALYEGRFTVAEGQAILDSADSA